jgi:hypothetical protein
MEHYKAPFDPSGYWLVGIAILLIIASLVLFASI